MRVAQDFFQGVGLYWHGVRTWSTDPRLMAIGLIPGALTMFLFLASFVVLGWGLDGLSGWVADRVAGGGALHSLVQVAAGLALIGAWLLMAVYAFVSVTSVVGQPFFEAISHRIDARLGVVPAAPAWPWWQNAFRGVGEGLRLLMLTAPLSACLLLIGLVPVVGTLVSWTLGTLVGGWFVALEFTAIAFERRGMRLADRRRILAVRRARTVGFGAMAFLMSVIPPVAVLTMPSAVAGGTALARRAIEEAETAARR